MVAKDGGVMPRTENDLCGLKVGLQAGTSWVNALKKLSAEGTVCRRASRR
jgi:polar amino acid transport system substrate-binding protein